MNAYLQTSRLAKAVIAGCSVLFTLVLAEFVFFPLLLPRLPLRLQLYLDDGIRVLAQSSKAAAVPRNYLAIIGDSYAQGRGDWLLSVDPNRNPPFHSAHVVHQRTGRDVVSFARGGAGSLRGVLSEPILSYRYLHASRRFGLEPPDVFLVYFYEGNDLQDTLLELLWAFGIETEKLRAGGELPPLTSLLQAKREGQPYYLGRVLEHPRLYDPEYFRQVLAEAALKRHPLHPAVEHFHVLDELYFTRFVAGAIAGEYRRARGRDVGGEPHPLDARRSVLRARNVLRIAGREHVLKRELQGPAPELSPEETDAALYAFEQSLVYLMAYFPGSDVQVVYLPSPAAVYEFVEDDVVLQPLSSRPYVYPVGVIQARSAEVRSRIEAIARRHAAGFVDPTAALASAARARAIHGPEDWRHFNRDGYTLLGEILSEVLLR